MKRSLQETAGFVQARVIGDGAVELTGIASLSSAAAGDLVFVEDEKNLRLALASRASAVIAGEFATKESSSKPLLICPQPRLAFARIAQLFYPKPAHEPGVHPSAVVDFSA